MKLTNKQQQEEFDVNNVKITRTIEGTIFEAVSAMFVIGAWVIALARHQFTGASGEQWRTGIITLTIMIVFLLVGAYFPRYMKNSHRLGNISQVLLSVRLCRILAIEIALAILCNAISNCTLMVQSYGPRIFLAVIIITAIVFSIFMRRAK